MLELLLLTSIGLLSYRLGESRAWDRVLELEAAAKAEEAAMLASLGITDRRKS